MNIVVNAVRNFDFVLIRRKNKFHITQKVYVCPLYMYIYDNILNPFKCCMLYFV